MAYYPHSTRLISVPHYTCHLPAPGGLGAASDTVTIGVGDAWMDGADILIQRVLSYHLHQTRCCCTRAAASRLLCRRHSALTQRAPRWRSHALAKRAFLACVRATLQHLRRRQRAIACWSLSPLSLPTRALWLSLPSPPPTTPTASPTHCSCGWLGLHSCLSGKITHAYL